MHDTLDTGSLKRLPVELLAVVRLYCMNYEVFPQDLVLKLPYTVCKEIINYFGDANLECLWCMQYQLADMVYVIFI